MFLIVVHIIISWVLFGNWAEQNLWCIEDDKLLIIHMTSADQLTLSLYHKTWKLNLHLWEALFCYSWVCDRINSMAWQRFVVCLCTEKRERCSTLFWFNSSPGICFMIYDYWSSISILFKSFFNFLSLHLPTNKQWNCMWYDAFLLWHEHL